MLTNSSSGWEVTDITVEKIGSEFTLENYHLLLSFLGFLPLLFKSCSTAIFISRLTIMF